MKTLYIKDIKALENGAEIKLSAWVKEKGVIEKWLFWTLLIQLV